MIQRDEYASFGSANAEDFFVVCAAHVLSVYRRNVVAVGFQHRAPAIADVLVQLELHAACESSASIRLSMKAVGEEAPVTQ